MIGGLAVSNLAWPQVHDEIALRLLSKLGVQGVEVAPTRLASWENLSVARLAAYRQLLAGHGLVVSSLQAVLYGLPELQLLGEASVFSAMLEHFRRIFEIAAALQATVLVFGAPRNRLAGTMAADVAWALARERLRLVGETATASGIIIGVEPVPRVYGGDFLTSWQDVLRMTQEVQSPGVRVHLDTGCVSLGGGDITAAINACAPQLTHFHAAQPQLGAFDTPSIAHADAASALRSTDYQGWVAIEMLEQRDGPLRALETAVRFVAHTYR